MARKKTHEEYVKELGDRPIAVVGEYKGTKTNILHKCLKKDCHHKWTAKPGNILCDQGCPECGKKSSALSRKKTHDQYEKEVKAIHGDTIAVVGEYKGNKTKIPHKCLQKDCHHEWTVTPRSILGGTGCPECGNKSRAFSQTKAHDKYEKEVKAIHGDTIEVLGEYNGSKSKLLHKCLQKDCHHEWTVRPYSILHGCGCPECGTKSSVLSRTKPHDQYKKEVKVIHGDTIEVSGEYKNAYTKIPHKCLQKDCHHEWTVTPHSILGGTGCPECGNKSCAFLQTKTHDQYEKEVKAIHGDTIAVLEGYKTGKTKIWHTCLQKDCHHEWTVTPNNILQGRGCPSCATSGIDPTQPIGHNYCFLLFLNIQGIIYTCSKYGLVTRPNNYNPSTGTRMSGSFHKGYAPVIYSQSYSSRGSKKGAARAIDVEKNIHQHFNHLRLPSVTSPILTLNGPSEIFLGDILAAPKDKLKAIIQVPNFKRKSVTRKIMKHVQVITPSNQVTLANAISVMPERIIKKACNHPLIQLL